MKVQNSNYSIGNRTRYIPTCSAVPQPKAISRVPQQTHIKSAPLYRHWRSVQAVRTLGGVEV